LGAVDLACMHKGNQYSVVCKVIDANVPNLLSLKDSVRMSLVKIVDAIGKSEQPQSIIDEFADVFHGIGKVPVAVSLNVDPNVSPVAQPLVLSPWHCVIWFKSNWVS
jgi:hypothetical protein